MAVCKVTFFQGVELVVVLPRPISLVRNKLGIDAFSLNEMLR